MICIEFFISCSAQNIRGYHETVPFHEIDSPDLFSLISQAMKWPLIPLSVPRATTNSSFNWFSLFDLHTVVSMWQSVRYCLSCILLFLNLFSNFFAKFRNFC